MTLADLTGLFAQRPSAFAWLIGAGASRMSGLPTANDVIADLKRQYYCREEGEEINLQDMRNEAVQARIQSFMDARGFPAPWSAEEYSGYFDKIFGADKQRQRTYLTRILAEDRVKLTVGNRVLAAMLAGGFTRAIFTTNFDSVVERAYAEVSGRSLIAFHLEGSTAALQALNHEQYPLYVKLHGDFRYDSIKNLTSDLAAQDRDLARCLIAAASRFGLIVAGYSGRDESVMALLQEALEQPNAFPAGLFWTDIKGARILPAVTDLITQAKAKGIRSGIVDIETYDTLMLRLWRNIEDKPLTLDEKVRRSAATSVTIPIPPAEGDGPILRLNALPVRKLPSQALAVETKRPIDWKELKELQRKRARHVLFAKGDQILAWGSPASIAELLGDDFVRATPTDLPSAPKGSDQPYIQGFLEEALVVALARGRPLIPRITRQGGILIANRNARDISALAPVKILTQGLFGPIPKLMTQPTDENPDPEPLFWAEALRVSLTWKNGMPWLLIDPDIWVWPPRGRGLATEFLDRRRRGRFNNRYNELVTAWIEVFFGKLSKPTDLRFSFNSEAEGAANASFEIGSRTAYSLRQAV